MENIWDRLEEATSAARAGKVTPYESVYIPRKTTPAPTTTPSPVVTPPSTPKVEEGGNLWDKIGEFISAPYARNVEGYKAQAEKPSFGEYVGRKFVGGAAEAAEGTANAVGYWQQDIAKSAELRRENALRSVAATTKNEETKKAINSLLKDTNTQETAYRPTEAYFNFGDEYTEETQQKFAGADFGKVGNLIGDVAEGAGGVIAKLPAQLVPGLGTVLTFASAYGNARQSAQKQGADELNSSLYAFGAAAVELATEKIFGFADVAGKGVLDDAITKGINKLAKSEVARKAIRAILGSVQEGGEEFLAELGQRYINELTINTDERTWGETAKDGLYNALVGGLTGMLVSTANLLSGGEGRTRTPEENKAIIERVAKQAAAETNVEIAQQSAENEAPTEGENLRSNGAFENAANVTSKNETPVPDYQGEVARENGAAVANIDGSIYSDTSTGAAALARGEMVGTQSKTIEQNINLSDKSRAANKPAQHERVSAALSLARAGANIYVDSDGNILLEQSIDNLLDKDRWTGSDSDAAELLMQEAESRADVDAVKRIAERIVTENTEAARLLQAQQKWIDASPGNRLAAMYAYVNKFAAEHKARKGKAIEIPDFLAKAYLEAETEAQRDEIIGDIQEYVARGAKPTFLEAWNALRYANMLGNFKTQARNILGNVANKAQYFAKNQLANLIEVAANKVSKGKIGRTKSAVVGREWMKAANADFANVRKRVQQYGKYTDDNFKGDFAQGIEDARKLLLPVLEQYRRATAWAMDTGDLIFSKSAYARSLAGYLKANGVQAQQLEAGTVPAGLLTKARDYAVRQAQEATFRDSNEFSDWVSRIGRRPDTPKAAKALAEGLLPFRRTPANVLVRAEEFSPLGLINTTVKAAQTKKGEATANDVIESLSKSLTGSALMMLGYFLANNGYLRASGDEEDEELDALLDKQDWAIQIPGVGSYTIDWMAPASLELFMGAQLQHLLSDEDLTFADVLDVFSGLTEPIIQMSMLSGVNDTLDGIKYSDHGLIQIAAQLAVGYLSQGLTNTLLGQIERTTEPERMSTYVDKQGALPDWLQRGIGKATAKTPFVDYQQSTYLNEFGETEQSGLGERLIENLISPGYFQREKTDNLYTFIEELAGKMDTKPFPDAYAPYSVTVGGESYDLTQEQRDAYQIERGQTAKEYLEFMQDSAEFNKLPVAYQEKVVSEVMSFANKKGAEAAVGNANFTKAEKFANEQMNAYEHFNWLISENSTPVASGYKTEPDWQFFERAASVLPDKVAISMMVAENESMGKKVDAAVKANIPLDTAVAYYRAINERNAEGKNPTAEQKGFRISMLGLTDAQEELLSEIFK